MRPSENVTGSSGGEVPSSLREADHLRGSGVTSDSPKILKTMWVPVYCVDKLLLRRYGRGGTASQQQSLNDLGSIKTPMAVVPFCEQCFA